MSAYVEVTGIANNGGIDAGFLCETAVLPAVFLIPQIPEFWT